MPDEVVTAASVNSLKGRFDKNRKNLMYDADEDMLTTEIAYGRR